MEIKEEGGREIEVRGLGGGEGKGEREGGRERERERERVPTKGACPRDGHVSQNVGKWLTDPTRWCCSWQWSVGNRTTVHWSKALVHDGDHTLQKTSADHLAGGIVLWCWEFAKGEGETVRKWRGEKQYRTIKRRPIFSLFVCQFRAR